MSCLLLGNGKRLPLSWSSSSSSSGVSQDSLALVEQHKSGFERPGDVEFEDYSQGINRSSSDSSLTPKGPLDLLGKNRNKNFWLFKKSKVEDACPVLFEPVS